MHVYVFINLAKYLLLEEIIVYSYKAIALLFIGESIFGIMADIHTKSDGIN